MPRSTNDSHPPLKQVEFLVLAVLYEQPLHGYGVVQHIEERTAGRVRLRPGDVYRVIYRLANRGMVEENPSAVDDAAAARRTYYALTDDGRHVARAEAEMLAEVSSTLIATPAGREGRS